MKRATVLILLVFSVMSLVCVAAEYPPDANIPWVFQVRTDGNDTLNGHTYATAKQTINSAVSSADNGADIYIWPGDYNENIDLVTANKVVNMFGTHREKSKIKPTTGSGIIMSSGSTLENLSVEAVEEANVKAVIVTNANDVSIKKCNLYGTYDGLFSTGSSSYLFVEDSIIKGKYDAVGHITGKGSIFKNDIIHSCGTSIGNPARCVYGGGNAIFDTCIFYTERAQDDNDVAGIFSMNGEGNWLVKSSILYTNQTGDNDSDISGVYIGDISHSAQLALEGVMIKTKNAGGGNTYDLNNNVYLYGELLVSDCLYDESKINGTITDISEQIAVDVNGLDGAAMVAEPNNAGIAAIQDIVKAGGTGDVNAILTRVIAGGSGPWTSEVTPEQIVSQWDANSTVGAAIKAKTDNLPADTISAIDAIPTAAENRDAVFGYTGVTAGGTWTFAEWAKYSGAWLIGKWTDSNDVNGYDISDAEDPNTTVLQYEPSGTEPFKTVTVP